MLTLKSPQILQETALRWKRECKIAFVATMGCLHEGHLALIDKAREFAQKTIVSIFVNPLQFAEGEDYSRYPRTFEADLAKLEEAKVDCVFAPEGDDLYPKGFATRVQVSKITEPLCGRFRPGHFEGVATVCLKLFQITQADFTVFGEKDFQQLRLIQQITEDLNLPITVIAHPIVRDKDGLALSSRNRYLSAEERTRALAIPEAAREMRDYLRSHAFATVGEVRELALKRLSDAALQVDYVEVASSRQLASPSPTTQVAAIPDARVFLAARVGHTRLIDNLSLAAGPAGLERPERTP